jgi:hypothetical protein
MSPGDGFKKETELMRRQPQKTAGYDGFNLLKKITAVTGKLILTPC